MPSFQSISLNDYDGQTGIVGVNIPEITSANIGAVSLAAGSFRTALEVVTLGVVTKSEMSIVRRFAASNVKATDQSAQRGNKWVISYRDTTEFLDGGETIPNPGYQKAFSVDIPTANLALRVNNEDVVWTSSQATPDADFDDLVDKFEALALSPYGGTPAVESIYSATRAGG